MALNPSRRDDQRLVDAVRAAAAQAPAVVALPEKSPGQPRLVLRTTNDPDAVAAAQLVRRRLAATGFAVTVSAAPQDQWRQLLDAGSYDLAVGTGLAGDQIGTVHYAMAVTKRIVGVPRLGRRGSRRPVHGCACDSRRQPALDQGGYPPVASIPTSRYGGARGCRTGTGLDLARAGGCWSRRPRGRLTGRAVAPR